MMVEKKVEIGAAGIKRALSRYDPFVALSEFVWNGFDAGADTIDIDYAADEIGHIPELRVTDNGAGIPDSELEGKFVPFLHSNRAIDPSSVRNGPSAVHGKNGIGRLTFFKFANTAEWMTCYRNGSQCHTYRILISSDTLNTYHPSAKSTCNGPTGTVVRFSDVHGLDAQLLERLRAYLASEFAWFLELRSPCKRTIRVNGEELDYKDLVADRDQFPLSLDGQSFEVRYVRWCEKLHDEYSRYYFVGSDRRERAKEHTTLNNKGDSFYHSVYVQSPFFDGMRYGLPQAALNEPVDQLEMDFSGVNQDVLRMLRRKLDEYLRHKRRPFLRKRAERYVHDLEQEKALPDFSADVWEQFQRLELMEIVREVYEAEPRIFNGLNAQQRQTMVRLFHLAMTSSERDSLMQVLDHVVNLDKQERDNLAAILRTTQLSNVVATIRLITDRYTAVDELRKLVKNKGFGANERDHLQSHIERHYWVFGEQYHLVTAAEPDFEQALRRFSHMLFGDDRKRKISHPDKNKEMDIFAVRWLPQTNDISSIVVELKHPLITLGEKHLAQVKKYMSVIVQEDLCNASNMTWHFYLVGNDYDDYIQRELDNARPHGERHVVYRLANYSIYVLKWSEVFANFECRHQFLLNKLKIERDRLATDKTSADEVLAQGLSNTAGAVDGHPA